MFCGNCGSEIKEGNSFCSHCGQAVKKRHTEENRNAPQTTNTNVTKFMDLENWKRWLWMSVVASVIGIILVAITSNMNINIVWNLCKIISYVCFAGFFVSLFACTVLAIKNKKRLPLWINVIQGIVLAMIIMWVCSTISIINQGRKTKKNMEKYTGGTSSSSTNNNNSGTTNPYNSKYITTEEFRKIEVGMTYEQVVAIIGGEGKLSSEDMYSMTYEWEPASGSDFYSVIITFMNGKVTGKLKI